MFDPYKADKHRLDLQQSLKEALDTEALNEVVKALDMASVDDVKRMKNPPPVVERVLEAVVILLDKTDQIPKDRGWSVALKTMANGRSFLNRLSAFDKDRFATLSLRRKISYIEKHLLSDVTVEKVEAISKAAAGLCSWVLAICKYARVAQRVVPMKAELNEMDNPIK